MEPREAAELLALMRGTWPRLAQDEIADRMWLEDLIRCDRKCALEAFRGLRDSLDRAPTWSMFLESYRAQLRRKGLGFPAIESATVPSPTDEEKARVRAVCEELARKLSINGRRAGGKVRSR